MHTALGCARAHKHVRAHADTHLRARAHTHTQYVQVFVCILESAHAYMHVCMSICVCVCMRCVHAAVHAPIFSVYTGIWEGKEQEEAQVFELQFDRVEAVDRILLAETVQFQAPRG